MRIVPPRLQLRRLIWICIVRYRALQFYLLTRILICPAPSSTTQGCGVTIHYALFCIRIASPPSYTTMSFWSHRNKLCQNISWVQKCPFETHLTEYICMTLTAIQVIVDSIWHWKLSWNMTPYGPYKFVALLQEVSPELGRHLKRLDVHTADLRLVLWKEYRPRENTLKVPHLPSHTLFCSGLQGPKLYCSSSNIFKQASVCAQHKLPVSFEHVCLSLSAALSQSIPQLDFFVPCQISCYFAWQTWASVTSPDLLCADTLQTHRCMCWTA